MMTSTWRDPNIRAVRDAARRRTRDIEIYTVSKRTGKATSSSMYTAAYLRDIFGERDAEKLMNGQKVQGSKPDIYHIAAKYHKGDAAARDIIRPHIQREIDKWVRQNPDDSGEYDADDIFRRFQPLGITRGEAAEVERKLQHARYGDAEEQEVISPGAFNRGSSDYTAGKPRSADPFKPGSLSSAAWNNGWQFAGEAELRANRRARQ